MAIAYDNASSLTNQTTDTYSFAHTCNGSDRLLVVGVFIPVAMGATVTGVTYDGNALTAMGSVEFNGVRVEMWRLIAPGTGGANVAVTLSFGMPSAAAAASFTGVHQTTPTESPNGNSGTSDTPSEVVTTVTDNAWAIGIVGTESGVSLTIGAGQENISSLDANAGGYFGSMTYEGPKTPAGDVTMSWGINDGSQDWVIYAEALVPAAEAPTTAKNLARRPWFDVDPEESVWHPRRPIPFKGGEEKDSVQVFRRPWIPTVPDVSIWIDRRLSHPPVTPPPTLVTPSPRRPWIPTRPEESIWIDRRQLPVKGGEEIYTVLRRPWIPTVPDGSVWHPRRPIPIKGEESDPFPVVLRRPWIPTVPENEVWHPRRRIPIKGEEKDPYHVVRRRAWIPTVPDREIWHPRRFPPGSIVPTPVTTAEALAFGLKDEAGTLLRTFYLPFNKLDATAAPGVSNDLTQGYIGGSLWIDRTAHKVYICANNATGAAAWIEIV